MAFALQALRALARTARRREPTVHSWLQMSSNTSQCDAALFVRLVVVNAIAGCTMWASLLCIPSLLAQHASYRQVRGHASAS